MRDRKNGEERRPFIDWYCGFRKSISKPSLWAGLVAHILFSTMLCSRKNSRRALQSLARSLARNQGVVLSGCPRSGADCMYFRNSQIFTESTKWLKWSPATYLSVSSYLSFAGLWRMKTSQNGCVLVWYTPMLFLMDWNFSRLKLI